VVELMRSIKANPVEDALARFVLEQHWPTIGALMERSSVEPGFILTAQEALDRTLFFVETGTLKVHYRVCDAEHVVTEVGPCCVVGEGTFFSQVKRSATVHAHTRCVVWALSPSRFDKLA
jgi:CRP-like cAMP-binding protein